jgi:orotidine-5'-phosphate decarboxylase
MTRAQLIEQINRKKSFLCVGLDSDLTKIPRHLLSAADPIFEFNKAIVDATSDFAVAYKPNIAFYECLGPQGWESLEKTLEVIPDHCFTIADAKRGDIGNTSRYYAQTFFERYKFDAVTVAPYMGSDSVLPFLEFEEKWVILLALTSNKGADDFQFIADQNKRLFEHVLEQGAKWGNPDRLVCCRRHASRNARGNQKSCPGSFSVSPRCWGAGWHARRCCQTWNDGRLRTACQFISRNYLCWK